jgi:hypothetical protein
VTEIFERPVLLHQRSGWQRSVATAPFFGFDCPPPATE